MLSRRSCVERCAMFLLVWETLGKMSIDKAEIGWFTWV